MCQDTQEVGLNVASDNVPDNLQREGIAAVGNTVHLGKVVRVDCPQRGPVTQTRVAGQAREQRRVGRREKGEEKPIALGLAVNR